MNLLHKQEDTVKANKTHRIRSVRRELSQNLIVYHEPKSHAAEAFRALRTNIGFAGIDNELKTIAVTSPEPSDGKSTTACNLAISLAQIDKKVLLIECDLRKPKIHRNFRMGNDVGLTHILADMILEDQSVISYVKEVPEIENLFILTAGFTPPNPVEILSSQKFKNFLDLLKKAFDIIVIDTPPVAQLADAAVVSKVTDGVLLVIASGKTNVQAAIRAKQALLNINANILGVVLTKIDKRSGHYYNYYNYTAYEDS